MRRGTIENDNVVNEGEGGVRGKEGRVYRGRADGKLSDP